MEAGKNENKTPVLNQSMQLSTEFPSELNTSRFQGIATANADLKSELPEFKNDEAQPVLIQYLHGLIESERTDAEIVESLE